MTSFSIAHVTDIHISEKEKTWGTLARGADELTRRCFAELNAIPDLDAVMITGDVLDVATLVEVERFKSLLDILETPWHFIPGNHDGYIDSRSPQAYQPHEALPLFDSRLADPVPYAQNARWSRPLKPGIHLIGLDSRLPDHWSGQVVAEQIAWLKAELDSHQHETVLIAIHHPTFKLTKANDREFFEHFILKNGEEFENLLDGYANVKLVMAGHHHANRVLRHESRLHVNTASLSGYPCEYRLMRGAQEGDRWRITMSLHTVADTPTLEMALRIADESDVGGWFDEDTTAWGRFCYGEEEDRDREDLL